MISNKLCNMILLYRSPSQNNDEFENFINNLNLTLESVTEKKPFLTVLLGDFNAKHNCCSDDRPTQEGRKIDNVASQFLLSQIIKEPTHISKSFSSCIDFTFTNQPNLVTDSCVHPSLHSNCHHQIVYAKFNFKIIYPPPYERHIGTIITQNLNQYGRL